MTPSDTTTADLADAKLAVAEQTLGDLTRLGFWLTTGTDDTGRPAVYMKSPRAMPFTVAEGLVAGGWLATRLAQLERELAALLADEPALGEPATSRERRYWGLPPREE